MQVSIEVQGLDKVQSTLKALQQNGEDTAPLMVELANHLYNVVDESFEKQQTPDGISWSPIQARRGDQTPDKILRDEGTMQDSLSSEHSSDEAIVGLNATENGYPYPIVHQFGRDDGTIEARAFMPIHEDGTLYDETEQEIEEILEDYMEEVLK